MFVHSSSSSVYSPLLSFISCNFYIGIAKVNSFFEAPPPISFSHSSLPFFEFLLSSCYSNHSFIYLPNSYMVLLFPPPRVDVLIFIITTLISKFLPCVITLLKYFIREVERHFEHRWRLSLVDKNTVKSLHRTTCYFFTSGWFYWSNNCILYIVHCILYIVYCM